MIFAAIDPGAVNAAVAVFHDGTPVFVDDIRTANGMLDAAAFALALRDMKVERGWPATTLQWWIGLGR